jgi:hypothetical protein
MASVYDIVKGINQAAANAYDGSQYENYSYDGTARTAGLKREKGDPIIDSRVMDGFSVRISGPKLFVSYHSEMLLSDFHNTKLDQEIEQTYADIVKFLKKEYKSLTKDTLNLKEDGPVDILLQNTSKIRTWVECLKVYTIGNMKDVLPVGDPSKDRLEANFKKFLELGTDKRPKNDKRKKSDK